MQWDPRRYLLSSVLNRISVFTNLDPEQLEFSGTSLSAANLEVDPDKLSSGSFCSHSATISGTSVELSTMGIRVALKGVAIDASLKTLAPDLGLSVVLEQVEHEVEHEVENAPPQEQAAPGFLAQTLLSQLRVDIHEIELLLRVGGAQVQVDIGSAFLEKTRLGIQDIVVSVGADILVHVENVFVDYNFPLTAASVGIDTLKCNTLPALTTIVQVVNVVLNNLASDASGPSTGSSSGPQVSLHLTHLSLADCPLDSTGQFEHETKRLELRNLEFIDNKLTLESATFPGLAVLGPLLEVHLGDVISVKVPHPVSLKIELADLSEILSLSKEIIQVVSALKLPETDQQAVVSIDLPDIKLQISQFTLLAIPLECTLEKLALSEVLLTCGTDRLVIANPELELTRNRVNVRRISGQMSQDTLREIEAIIGSIDERDLRAPNTEGDLGASNESFHSTDSLKASSDNMQTPCDILQTPLDSLQTPLEPSSSVSHDPPSHPSPARHPPARSSFRVSIDSIVLTMYEYTLSSTLIASYNGDILRAKLKPELVFDDNRFTAHVQLVFSDSLLIYCDIKTAVYNLKQLERAEAVDPSTPATAPFKAPFPIEMCIKGRVELNSPIKRFAVSVPQVLCLSFQQDALNARLPHLEIAAMDHGAEIPLAVLEELNMRGNFTKNQFATTIKAIEAGACADSLDALKRLAEFVQPAARTAEFTVDGPEGLDVFDGVDDSAFVSAAAGGGEDKGPGLSSLQYVESYYPNARARDSLATFEQLNIVPMPLNIQDDYLLDLRSASPKLAHQSKLRVRLLIKAFTFNLHDGFDFHDTRKALSAAVDRVSKLSNRLGEMTFENNESPIVGDLMFNSIYIGACPSSTDNNNNLKQEIDREMGSSSLCRSASPKLSLRTSRAQMEFKSFEVEKFGDILSDASVKVEEFIVRDLVPSSKWKALISYNSSVQGNLKGSMLSLGLEQVHGADPELRIKVTVCPLRVQIDQDTLDFATRFFEFQPESGIQEEEEDETARAAVAASSLSPFIQRFEISDVYICLDYRPKKVDYAGLRSGHAAEFMNLFVVEKSSIVLRHLVLHGIAGFSSLGASLNNVWTPDVRNNQLVAVLSGLGPLKSIFQVAGGVKKFFVVPVREYKRESGVATGLRRGSTSLAKNTANELLKLGVRVINGPRKRGNEQENESVLID